MRGEGWEDAPFDIFDPDPPPRPKTLREIDLESRVRFLRWSAPDPCWQCIDEISKGSKMRIPQRATWQRLHEGERILLCAEHKVRAEGVA